MQKVKIFAKIKLMKVNVFLSQVSSIANEEMLKTLVGRQNGFDYIIITPDRCNFNIENLVFDILNEDSLFDVNVMTMTRFTRKILGLKHENKKILTMQGACSIIQKILIENKDELLSFGKSYAYKGFSKELFETISMFKSCHIHPENINDNVSSQALQNKLHDIKLVYSKYEEFLQGEYTDSFNRLNLLKDTIGDEVNATHFYLLGFDDFTIQQYGVIQSLIKHAASVNIATTKSDKLNKSIYLNNVYYNLVNICDLLGVMPSVKYIDNGLDKNKQFVADYAFSFGGKGDISNYLNVLKFDNAQDEIEYVSNEICLKLIKNNAKFDDFCVVLPSFDGMEEKVKHAFENVGIPYFIDKSKTLRDVSVFSFISKLINLPINFSRENLMELLHNAYLNLDYYAVCDYCRHVIEKGLYGDALYLSEDENILSVLSTLKSVDTDSHTVSEHLSNMLELFDKLNFVGALTSVMQSYKDSDIVEYRTLSQTQTKLAKIVEELNGVLGDYECDYSTFVLLVDSYIDNTSIALPPITSCVFVADQKSSYFAHKKYVYMLNVNEGIVPAYNADLGIISDEDMAKIDKKLSPTIAYTNKKIRYKVFENLFSADCTLTLCNVNMSSAGEKLYPASFMVNLAKMGGVEDKSGSKAVDIVNANFEKIDKQNILFNSFSKSNAEKNYITLLKSTDQIENKALNKLAATLGKVVDKPEYVTNIHYENIKKPIDANGVYFPYGKSSISQVQTYYKCPYKHFASYALRLKEQISDNIRPLDYGNIIHRFLELSVGQVENCDNLSKLAKDTIEQVLKEDEYVAIATSSKNIYNIKALKRECLRILKTIKNQLSVSEFKPKYYEKEFSGVEVKLGGKTITFGGVIDRVDTYDNYFRIIDYKTGSDDFKDFGEVAKGVRLQLIMYLKAYMDKTHLLPAGAFYMPISVSFDNKKDGDSMYKYKGIILNEINNMFAMDSTLREPRTSSKVINVAMDKDGRPTKTGANLRLSHEEIVKLTDYVYNMLVKAVEKILSGDISPEPYKNGNLKSCKYCPYKAMCNFSEDYKNTYNEYVKIENISEL